MLSKKEQVFTNRILFILWVPMLVQASSTGKKNRCISETSWNSKDFWQMLKNFAKCWLFKKSTGKQNRRQIEVLQMDRRQVV